MNITLEQRAKYLARRHDDLQNLNLFLRVQNFTEIENIGHKLKGSGSTFGFAQISSLGQLLEEAAQNKSYHSVLDIVDNLSRYLNSLDKPF